jgi:predicted membrane-bound mannosyltransferase
VVERPPVPADARDAFSARLPLAWYTERMGAETASVSSAETVPESLPPVVVTTPRHAPALSDQMGSYSRFRVDLALSDRTVVVYVQE